MPYLRNAWYVAAASNEIGEAPLRRVLLDLPSVIYRTESGVCQVLRDSCPHRFAPLSLGMVIGETLQCGYHGLKFGTDGRCVHNPHGSGTASSSLRVRSFPTIERFGYIWFWPGQDEADPELLPAEYIFLDDAEQYAVVHGYLHVKANYELIVDNLLDLTHVQYIHPQFGLSNMTTSDQLKAHSNELVREGNRVGAKRLRANTPPSDFNRTTFGVSADLVDTRADMYWQPPANIFFDMGLTEPGEPNRNILRLPAAHMITPETDLTSHYFFAQGRDAGLDDEALSATHLSFTEFAFREQDEPMLEAQQANMGRTADIMALGPALLKTDGAPVTARRILKGLIKSEQDRLDPEHAMDREPEAASSS